MFRNNPTTGNFSYIAQINSVYQCTLPIFINQMNQAIMRRMVNSNDLKIGVTVSPLKNTD